MYLGKLSSFLRCFNCVQLNQSRLNSTWQDTCDTVQKCLGVPRSHAYVLVKSHRLSKLTTENIAENVELLNSFGYTNQEIADNGLLLGRPRKKLQDQYLVLQEVGFNKIPPIVLVNFRKLIHKTVRTLKRMSFLPEDCNVMDNLLLHLNPKPADFIFKFNDDDAVAKMHCAIVKRYLQWRLEVSFDEIERFFRVNHSMKFKSFQYLCQNIDFALSIGFTPKQLLSFSYLLVTDPSYPKTILKETPKIADLDMKVAMRRHPRLATISPSQFRTIYDILKKEKVSDAVIQKSIDIFTLCPKTVKARFEELKSVPEMYVLRQNPRILKLIVNHNRARSRLSFMKDLELKCYSMVPLAHASGQYFDSRIKSGKDAHLLYEIVLLLKHMLKGDAKEIQANLQRHPLHLQIPLLDIEKTVKYLQKQFKNKCIVKVLPIVLYPPEKIQGALNELDAMEKLRIRRLTNTKKLHAALYIMEKKHHFTGNGVWADKT